ncbi:type II secretion system protein J [Candidatus Omnitrophota bacterium]
MMMCRTGNNFGVRCSVFGVRKSHDRKPQTANRKPILGFIFNKNKVGSRFSVLGFSAKGGPASGGRNCRKPNTANRKPIFGFTLVEVMIATAVLSLSTVLIHEAFFNSLDLFNYYSNYLRIISLADEKVWQAQNSLTRFGTLINFPTTGIFNRANNSFNWNMGFSLLDEEQGLYSINLVVTWQGGRRKRSITRTAYAIYKAEN